MSQQRIIAVDDDPLTLKLLTKILGLAGHEVIAASSGDEALELLRRQHVNLAVVDIRMPGMSGLDLLRAIKQQDLAIEVVMTTAYPEVWTAIEALKEGAYDYLVKPLNQEELCHCVARAMERRFLRGEVSTLRARLGDRLTTKELVGVSPEMVQLKKMIALVATSDSAVLIRGESGTGKELVACAIHRLSPRRSKPMIPVNCSAIPTELMESEFFGHVRGAFTGAVGDTLGLFRSAHGGTLFLDEVTELPLSLQAKLLRVLQEREVRPVGSTKTYLVDVRIIAATNRDPEQAVKEGKFRADLFYRLNVVQLTISPLRERKEDIPVLVAHFIKQFNEQFSRHVEGIESDVLELLMAFEFRGNVRQLENLLERAYALGATGPLKRSDFPAFAPQVSQIPAGSPLPTLEQAERDLIQRALAQFQKDRGKTARALGISPRTLYRRLQQFGLV